MTTSELKPCPFCGGTEIHFGPMEAPGAWMVGCNNYDCPLGVDSVTVEFGTPEKAVAAWNTRATDANLAALQAEIEALRAENEAMKRCAIKYLGWLGVTHMPLDQALHDDMCNPSMCGDAALLKENSND